MPLPVVAVNTINPNITEGGVPGQFIFSINSPQNNNIAINYTIGGTATNGIDYQAITLPFVTIPAGTNSAVININSIADGIPEPVETVNLNLQPSGNNSYIVGGVNAATININDTLAVREIDFDSAGDLREYPIDPLTGVTFNNALGIVSFAQTGSGNFTDSVVDVNPASQGRAITYSQGNSIIMNVPDGFSELSFRYASPFVNHQVVVYDGPNATGNVLANEILDRTSDSLATPGAYVLTPEEQQINFNGFAQSVSFGSEPNKLIIDDIRLFG
ncbi:MAG: hypothetical protein F6K13_29445 [Okeania sp. SIO2B9]|nr:hypothetical protein [Okeania sp. SIO2B9]